MRARKVPLWTVGLRDEEIRRQRRERELSTVRGLLRAAWTLGKQGNAPGLAELLERGDSLIRSAECKGWDQGVAMGVEVATRPPSEEA